jgi:hypothetical protein
MVGLLAAGFAVLLAGLIAVGFGVPVKEFSFGNTLISAGALATCTGMILIALGFILRELKAIARAITQSASAGGHPNHEPGFGLSEPVSNTARSRPRGSPHEDRRFAAATESASGRQEQFESSEQIDAPDETGGPAFPVEPETKKRRNLLFMSTRRDRKQPASEIPDADTGAVDEDMLNAGDEHDDPFDASWPTPDRERPDPSLRRPVRPADTNDGVSATRPVPPPIRRPSEAPPITILKSGVVDGMAYSLYSDGSIEAQMPEGMVRFSSLEELRNYLDQRGQ